MMVDTLELVIINAILNHPSLYKDIDYEHSRQKVLSHLFFTNGNGYEWVNGALVCELDKYKVGTELPESYFETPVMSTEANEPKYFKELRLAEGKEYEPYELCSKQAIQIYPICQYAKMMNIPDDIKDDWLEGAIEATIFARDYWDSPYKYCLDTYVRDWMHSRDYEKIKEYKKEQIGYLNKAFDRLVSIKASHNS